MALCLTVVGTIVTQVEFEDAQVRLHQHRAAEKISGTPDYGPLDCIDAEEVSAYQFGISIIHWKISTL